MNVTMSTTIPIHMYLYITISITITITTLSTLSPMASSSPARLEA